MFQQILVPLDGSARAEAAVHVAARVARASGGTITLLRVLSSAEFLPYIFAALEPSTLSADIDTANVYLQAVAQMPDLADVTVRTEVHSGPATSMILDRARANNADLLVMTSHGHTGLRRWALGSVSSKVARQSPVPVLVLREDGGASGMPATERPLCALVALDGSPASESALAPATQLIAALAAGGPSRLHLLHVLPPSAVRDRHETTLDAAKDYLRRVAEHLKAGLAPDAPFAVTWSVAQSDDIAEAVTRTAAGEEGTEGSGPGERCAVVALATSGQGGAGRGSLGAVAERVLNDSLPPVLLVRPPEE